MYHNFAADGGDLHSKMARAYSIPTSDKKNRDWSKMADDITRLIVRKLSFYPHYRKFAASCSDWYRITKEVHGPFDENSVSLVLPYNNTTEMCSIYRISDSVVYEFSSTELREKFTYGCTNGWLVVGYGDFGLSLINPMTQQRVDLPKPNDDVIEGAKFYLTDQDLLNPFNRHHILEKVVLSGSPSSPDCRVAAIMSLWNNLYICNLGDRLWYDPTTAQLANRDPKFADKCTLLNDALFFKGRLYAINSGWNVAIVEFDGPNYYSARVLTGPMNEHPSIVIRNWNSLAIMRTYLVVCSGNLLAVQKIGEFFRDGTKPHRTQCFLLYQFEEDTEKWSRIYGLGDKSLFLGKNESICVSAAQVQGCRPNCIYFADDFFCLQDKYEFGYRSGINGVFSCENRTVELFDISHSVSHWVMPAVWCQLKF